MGFLDKMFGGEAEREAADRDRAATALYSTQAQDALKTGYATGTDAIGKQIGAYAPLSDLASQYNKGGSTYLDALGLNGAQAGADARSMFANSAGYNLGIDPGLDVINRRRGTSGMYDSGNADMDAMGLRNQMYQNWLAGAQGAGQTGVGLSQAAAGGQAAGYGNLANLAQTYGTNQANVFGTVAGQNINASNLQGQGEASGAKNLLGAGLSLASLAMAPMTGGTSLMGGLSSMFGGGGSPSTGPTFGGYGGGTPGRGSMGGIPYPAY